MIYLAWWIGESDWWLGTNRQSHLSVGRCDPLRAEEEQEATEREDRMTSSHCSAALTLRLKHKSSRLHHSASPGNHQPSSSILIDINIKWDPFCLADWLAWRGLGIRIAPILIRLIFLVVGHSTSYWAFRCGICHWRNADVCLFSFPLPPPPPHILLFFFYFFCYLLWIVKRWL